MHEQSFQLNDRARLCSKEKQSPHPEPLSPQSRGEGTASTFAHGHLMRIVLVVFVMTASTAQPQDMVTGASVPELADFDHVMLSFLKQHELPGAVLAVANRGQIVYERGFGFADREKKIQVQPTSLFRVGSISKPITAVAVLQLVEKNKLKLDDRVFDVLKLAEPNSVPFDARWKDVTILQLLQHTGGWDKDKSSDPMGPWPEISKKMNLKSPADRDGIIRYMLRQPLQFDPGTQHHYSNFGYCLLGRVIEKTSGETYESFVKKHVLVPLGIKTMRLGKTALSGRIDREVKYYPTDPEDPYKSWFLETLDSAGGWLGTAKDVLHFGLAFEHPKQCKILNEASIATMYARPPGAPGQDADGKPIAVYYGCGWNVHPFEGGVLSTWHLGSLPGTSGELAQLGNGVTFSVLFNARDTSDKKHAAGRSKAN